MGTAFSRVPEVPPIIAVTLAPRASDDRRRDHEAYSGRSHGCRSPRSGRRARQGRAKFALSDRL